MKADAMGMGGIALAILAVLWIAKNGLGNLLGAAGDAIAGGAAAVGTAATAGANGGTKSGVQNAQATIDALQTNNGMTTDQATAIELLGMGGMGA